MYSRSYTFQEKISELFEGFDRIRAYVGNIFIINKEDFIDNLKALKKVLQKPTESELKILKGIYPFDKRKPSTLAYC